MVKETSTCTVLNYNAEMSSKLDKLLFPIRNLSSFAIINFLIVSICQSAFRSILHIVSC